MPGDTPLISVVLPVHNGEPYLGEAIESVLAQSMTAFELVIVDDGSTDNSLRIATSFPDSRISVVALESNVGLAEALNRGIDAAKAGLIARQDADDVSLPHRLRKQLDLFTLHSSTVLAGTWANVVRHSPGGRWNVVGQHRHPTTDAELRFRLLWNNPFVHSSVVFRRDAFEAVGGYGTDPATSWPEDYDLWSRLMDFGSLANLPEVLVEYRQSPGGISQLNQERMRSGVVRIASRNLGKAAGRDHDDPVIVGIVRTLNSLPTPQATPPDILRRLSVFAVAQAHQTRRPGARLIADRLRASGKLLVRSLRPVRDSLVL